MQEAIAVHPRENGLAIARAFQELTKPGITIFVGLTAIAGYVVAAMGNVNGIQLFALLVATMAMSGAAATLNQIAERDVDVLMRRTATRPLPSGLLGVRAATAFAWMLTLMGASVAAFLLPPLTLLLLAICHISYVYAYTPLKRRSELCTLVGAIPGALPVLAGASVATSQFGAAALALTALLFMWQIPHFMAIGWVTRQDYARAGFVMLPVTDSKGKRTARVALLYAVATQGFAILMTREAAVGPMGVAVIHTAGTAYVMAALLFVRTQGPVQAKRLFFTSLMVLPVILAAVVFSVATRA